MTSPQQRVRVATEIERLQREESHATEASSPAGAACEGWKCVHARSSQGRLSAVEAAGRSGAALERVVWNCQGLKLGTPRAAFLTRHC